MLSNPVPMKIKYLRNKDLIKNPRADNTIIRSALFLLKVMAHHSLFKLKSNKPYDNIL